MIQEGQQHSHTGVMYCTSLKESCIMVVQATHRVLVPRTSLKIRLDCTTGKRHKNNHLRTPLSGTVLHQLIDICVEACLHTATKHAVWRHG